MGESYLSGTEFKDSGYKEKILLQALEDLKDKDIRLVMKNDEITVLVDCIITLNDIVRRENRIETGHLTLDDIYFELVNSSGIKIYFPLVQFKEIVRYGKSLLFNFDSYRWMIIER